jgi:hypothetical protein
LVAYVGALALLAIVGIHFFDQLPAAEEIGLPPQRAAAWRARSYPTFAARQFDLPEKTKPYEGLRPPEGVIRWAHRPEMPVFKQLFAARRII